MWCRAAGWRTRGRSRCGVWTRHAEGPARWYLDPTIQCSGSWSATRKQTVTAAEPISSGESASQACMSCRKIHAVGPVPSWYERVLATGLCSSTVLPEHFSHGLHPRQASLSYCPSLFPSIPAPCPFPGHPPSSTASSLYYSFSSQSSTTGKAQLFISHISAQWRQTTWQCSLQSTGWQLGGWMPASLNSTDWWHLEDLPHTEW